MAKHGFKVSERNSKLVVADSVGEVGAAPTITDEGMVIDVVGDEVVAVPQGWDFAGGETDEVADTGQGGSVILSGDGEVVATLACEPDVIRSLAALVADDDGMGQMQATDVMLPVAHVSGDVAELFGMGDLVTAGLVVIDGDASVTDAALEVVASEPSPSPFAALVADFKPVMVADSVVRVDLPAMVAGEARLMAQRIADLTGATVTVTGPDGDEAIAPRSRGGSRVAAASGGATAKAPRAPKAERDWLAFDGEAQWGGSDTPWARGYVKVWRAIRDAANKLDMDSLLAFDFAGAHDDGTGNSFSKSNGGYLRAQIAKVRASRMAIDTEFGFEKLAAD